MVDESVFEAAAEMEYKAGPAQFKAMDQGEYEGHFAIIGNVDDGGDRILPGAFKKTLRERRNRVKVFYAHDWGKLIGPPPTRLEEDERGLFAAGRLTLESFWGREAFALMKDGALTEGSIGYKTIKHAYADEEGVQVRNLKEIQLLEISPVPIGMNAATAVRAVKRAMLAELKRAIPPHTTAKADEDAPWDAAAVVRQAEGARQLRLIHAWVDEDADPDSKGAYKLPHHYADGRVVWRGVAAAGGVIMGARGGADIPQSDIPGVKRHLARHYDQFDKTPPWEAEAGLDVQLETLYVILEAVKQGRALVTAEPQAVKRFLDETMALCVDIGERLQAAEPIKPIDHLALALRAEAAERSLRLATMY